MSKRSRKPSMKVLEYLETEELRLLQTEVKRRKIQAKKEKNAKCMALQRQMESSQQRQTRLQDISARKTICSQLETLEMRAESNIQNVIVSDPEVGVASYGLTSVGKQQAKKACGVLEALLLEYNKDVLADKMIVISSDFMRTRETAEIVHEHFSVKTSLRLDPRLRERGMGNLEKKAVQTYFKILLKDEEDPTHTEEGVESVTSMVLKMTRAVCDLDKEFKDKIILLVSHGDPLITLYAICCGVSPCERFKKLSPFQNCDVREVDCLPL